MKSRAGCLYTTTVRHVRNAPLHNEFRYRSYHWLVDLDALPDLPRPLRSLARFDAADHLGEAGASIRDNVCRYLAAAGVSFAGGRIVMLAHARVFGYVFNPLSVFWCYQPDGAVQCVVAEVHNTYGGRHRYLLRPDEAGGASVDKAFYVSPFYPVDGRYQMRLPEPGESLDLAITLHRPGQAPFVTRLRGERRPATVANLVGSALRCPWVTLLGAVQIRYQGLRLWAKGLPVVPRPNGPQAPAESEAAPGNETRR
ncbi:MAG: DUF1365 domain-containing protein [Acidimicrobiia bacterium]